MDTAEELFIVFGGGCFGTHHVRHIEKGRKRGRISPGARIIMVDRNAHPPALDLPEVAANPHLTFVQSDWLEYMKGAWDALPPDAEAVPAPVAPHLAFEWLVWSLRERLGESAIGIAPVEHSFEGLPYDYLAPSGARFISAADWICPTNCRAPHICPMTRDTRTWELEDTVNDYARAHPDLFAASVVFKPKFRVPGIDTLHIRDYTEARDRLLALTTQPEAEGKSVVVGTVSSCHGAVSRLTLPHSILDLGEHRHETTHDEPSQELVEPFVIAAHGDLAQVKALLEQEPALLNVPWARFDETALQAASHMGNREIADYLLGKGAPLNICAAAMLGRTEEVASFLREDPTQANALGAHGISLIYHAALSGQTEVGDLILAAGGGGEGMSDALHAAIQFGHTEMARWLLNQGATDVNAPNFQGQTPLAAAEERGHSEIAAMLRERGGTLEIKKE